MNVVWGQVTATLPKLHDGSSNKLCHYFAFASSLADNDTMHLKEAMAQPNRDKSLEAMFKEIEDHNTRGHWQITTRAEMKAKGYTHRPHIGISPFKRKRNLFGRITK